MTFLHISTLGAEFLVQKSSESLVVELEEGPGFDGLTFKANAGSRKDRVSKWTNHSLRRLSPSTTSLGRAGTPVTGWNKARWNYYSNNEKKKGSACHNSHGGA